MSTRLEELLRAWLPAQRWFAGKDRAIRAVRIVADVDLGAAASDETPQTAMTTETATTETAVTAPRLRHLIAAVDHGEVVTRYQIPIGLRNELPARLRHALIGWCEAGAVYDAVWDPELTHLLLAHMADGVTVGEFSFRAVRGAELRTDLRSLVIGTQQSNTSFVYGEDYVCKLFRRLEPGPNPDLETSLALAEDVW